MEQSLAITRRSASNLALAFVALDPEKRLAMSVLYAFCREVDDVADEDTCPLSERRERLAQWREDVRRACNGTEAKMAVNRELEPVARRFGLPFELFDELIRGVEMDLEKVRYESFDELDRYCYRVASVVGLLSIRIFGYTSPACRDYAVHLGKALQLTNILRDVRHDAQRGRIYLPLALLREHGVDEQRLLQGELGAGFRAAASAVAERARGHYQRAARLLPEADRRSMVAAECMGAVYWRLLRKLERRGFSTPDCAPASLGKPHKLWLVLRTWWRVRSGSLIPNYGAD